MHRIFRIIGPVEYLLRLFGLDVYTLFDETGLGFFNFRAVNHRDAMGNREYWGLGLYVMVSRLKAKPAAATA